MVVHRPKLIFCNGKQEFTSHLLLHGHKYPEAQMGEQKLHRECW